ncbi:hypothetical protein ACN47E_002646 [Coniothyrium glycines]
MPLTDQDTAIQAIAALERLSDDQQNALRAINTIACNGEPFVHVHDLFSHFNILYFRKLLLPRVEVIWSPKLTLCAGVCELSKDPSTGKFTRIRLKLSTPLLQYRPRSDTINTLLHEAIHAYFFITTSWKHSRGDDGTGHGTGFQLLADAINNHGNYEITVYHTFHDEVESYRTHIWQCDGPCRSKPPYFGLVKRSMNRAPGKGDTWWAKHQDECGGVYNKIQEPAPTKKQLEAMSTMERAGRQKNKLDAWVKSGSKTGHKADGSTSAKPFDLTNEDETSGKSCRNNAKTESVAAGGVMVATRTSHPSAASQKRQLAGIEDYGNVQTKKKLLVACPICNMRLAEAVINEHLDTIHK